MTNKKQTDSCRLKVGSCIMNIEKLKLT